MLVQLKKSLTITFFFFLIGLHAVLWEQREGFVKKEPDSHFNLYQYGFEGFGFLGINVCSSCSRIFLCDFASFLEIKMSSTTNLPFQRRQLTFQYVA